MKENNWHHRIFNWIYGMETDPGIIEQLAVSLVIFILVLVAAFVAYFVTRKLIYGVVAKIVKATPNEWDDELLNSKLFTWVSLLVPIAILWKTALQVFDGDAFGLENEDTIIGGIGHILQVITQVTAIVLIMFSLMSALNIVERIYNRYEVSKKLPLKSFLQVFKVLLFMVGVILIISSVMDKSPSLIFTGLGAATAILMLIFKDAILGLVAGIQLSANQMVSVGDWIEMPKFGADGEVEEVALTTVKVINWDKTITTVPTYALISDSFKNWRGMSESGVRRIKRAMHFDMQSVRILKQDEIEEMRKISLLSDYLASKETEISNWNKERGLSSNELVNARALTNIGTFRAYVVEYLKNHPNIDEAETILVRHLSPSDNGLPIEIYAFSNDNAWVNFEGIQSDIFDHLMAITSEFGLRLFQRPSGLDLSSSSFAD
ncbi:MAG: mechanosensitive ion channel domain-containing protein [Rubritalea sp.]|uniref:mechanosensitive ion channel family protein n=1 Tax=Rubritalea sp. TaxID=2109375 RepID=UPI003242F63F